jgi:hypothetical protein
MMDVSLDGLVARPGKLGAGGWGVPPEDPALKARKLGWLGDAGVLDLVEARAYAGAAVLHVYRPAA